MRFEAAIFDYEGVLVEMDRARAISFFRDRVSASLKLLIQRWETWCSRHAEDRWIADDMWRAFWDSVSGDLGIARPVLAEIHSFDYLGLFRVCPDALEALADARQFGLRVGVLSNSALPRLESASAPIDLLRIVDVIQVPGRGSAVKPDRRAYLDIARSLGASPDRCLFFDDEPTFVEAAREAGMHGYLVRRGPGAALREPGVVGDLSAMRELAEGRASALAEALDSGGLSVSSVPERRGGS